MKINIMTSNISKIDKAQTNNKMKDNLNSLNFKKLEFELVLRDYDKVIELDPNFIYAYFNRANVYCMQKDYAAALVDLNKAIEINPEFAEALFNRGLIHIFRGKTELGINDLSKAGELGVVGAYNLLKRLQD
jgi:Tetratricopeptide repeat.